MSTFATTMEGTEADNANQVSFRRSVLQGRWGEDVIPAFRNNSDFHKIKINQSRGTALHVAVNDGKLDVVSNLLGAILQHEGREVVSDDSALKSTNERGDTPLHLAASRGFIDMCKCIIGENGERKDLIKVKNNNGETPIFRAVLTYHKKTFVYLHQYDTEDVSLLTNNDGDTILHRAIWRELFDLAIIITACYPGLVNTPNKEGATPLKVLAGKPSAFKSGSSLPWWKQILYYCILVGSLDADLAIKSYKARSDKSGYREHRVPIQFENEAKARSLRRTQTLVVQKYATSVRFAKSIVRLALKGLSLSRLGVTARDFKAIKKIKQKNKWSLQILNVFMETTSESYIGNTEDQPFEKYDGEDKNLVQSFNTQQQLQRVKEECSKVAADCSSGKKPKKEHDVNKKETAFLTAAKNGIMEIVFELLRAIPSTIHETNCNNENVLLVAVKNRQTEVIELLQKNLDKELFDCLIFEVDNEDNTVLHLAAGKPIKRERTWQIAGSAMQMMWDIKWYEYIKDLVPDHFSFINNKNDETPWEIFEQNHQDLMEESSKWLKETSNSCSVVAALIASVSFATSSTVPGGTDKGKPTLEGQPAFDAFAIASLIGLSFSVTALTMFLAILTSRKQVEDFRKSLPLKLLFGLTSLFVSIGSMLVSFCAAHFFVLKDKYKNILFPFYGATCLPVTFYAVMQFPLYFDLLRAIFKKVPQRAKR